MDPIQCSEVVGRKLSPMAMDGWRGPVTQLWWNRGACSDNVAAGPYYIPATVEASSSSSSRPPSVRPRRCAVAICISSRSDDYRSNDARAATTDRAAWRIYGGRRRGMRSRRVLASNVRWRDLLRLTGLPHC